MINVYVTYDKISEGYSMPLFAKNDKVAIRNLRIASARENVPLDDIKLILIGRYDPEKGLLYDSADGNIFFECREIDINVINNKE